MMSNRSEVSVIVPTRALQVRADSLHRAIQSILAQEAVRAIPLVVVNGPDADPELVASLTSQRIVRVFVREEADLPAALLAGRERVDTPWFSELDDDDLLAPGALDLRLRALEEDRYDAVVTNGVLRTRSGDTLLWSGAGEIRRDPLRAMFDHNWLLPGSWLCRTETVGTWLFQGMPRFLECTYIGVQLSLRCRIRFLDEPTVIHFPGILGSESKSQAYVFGQEPALRRFLELPLPGDVRTTIRRRIAAACHRVADLEWEEGRLKDAWLWHLRSLRVPWGWRYASFTRHLILPRKRL
jgi:glycosyltransferase involved in cell wall biosynthesis